MTTHFLRIASAISLLFTLGHSAGGLRKWSPMGDDEEEHPSIGCFKPSQTPLQRPGERC